MFKSLVCASLLAVLTFSSSCVRLDAIVKDVQSCVKADEAPAIVDLEKAAPKLVEDLFTCNPTSEAAIPVCVAEGLATLDAALGPDAERFKLCVTNTIENDPAATKLIRARAKAVRMKAQARGEFVGVVGYSVDGGTSPDGR